MEGVTILHDELAAAHDPEARTDLVAELRLDLVEVPRELAVAFHFAAHDVGDHLLVGRADHEVAVMPVLEAQEFRAVLFPAARFFPELGGLNRGHEEFDGPGAVHLLADDALDLAQSPQTHGHPGIDAGCEAADQAGPEHQTLGDDLRVGGGFLEGGDEELAGAHGEKARNRKSGHFTAAVPLSMPAGLWKNGGSQTLVGMHHARS